MRFYKVVGFPLYYTALDVENMLNRNAEYGWELHTITSHGNEGVLVLSKDGAPVPDYKNMKPDVYGQYTPVTDRYIPPTATGQYGDH